MLKAFTIYFDGASKGNPGPAGIGGVVIEESGKVHEVSRYIGVATNNQAEYKALLETLQLAAKLSAENIQVFSDSELVVRQLTGEYQVKDPKLRPLCQEVLKLCSSFRNITFQHVPREKNKHADSLANQAVLTVKKDEQEKWVEFSIPAGEISPLLKELEALCEAAGKEKNIPEIKKPEKLLSIRFRRDGKAVHLEW